MLYEQNVENEHPISRRAMMKGLAGLALLTSGVSCTSSSSSSSSTPTKVAPSPSPTLGTTLFTYKGHYQDVLALSWSPDSKRIASGSLDKTVQVWDAMTGKH